MSDDHAYSERFDQAVGKALEHFRPIYRKAGRVPYITHLMAVTALVGEHGGDEDQMIAAILHDYLEDIEHSSHEELVEEFGEKVADYVVHLSDTTAIPKPPWRPRKERYIEALRSKPDEVKLISAADKLHNVRSIIQDQIRIGDEVFERFSGGREGTLWYYRKVVQSLGEDWDHQLLDELHLAVERMHELAGRPLRMDGRPVGG